MTWKAGRGIKRGDWSLLGQKKGAREGQWSLPRSSSQVDERTEMSELAGEAGMEKRDRFLAELRDEAKAKGLAFKVEKGRGKGGHALVWVGQRWTTLPSRDIDPKTARKIRKGLGTVKERADAADVQILRGDRAGG
jgi:hypothetical protein